MKRNTIIILGVVAAAGLYFFMRGKAAKRLQVAFYDLKLGEIKGLKIPDIFARFKIINPTSTPLSVNSIAGEVFLNNILFSSVSNLDKAQIPGNSETLYSVKITPGLSAFYALYNLIKNKKNADIVFKGTVNTTGVVLPINEAVSLKLWK
jgi:LEA14-like dessication related protein